VAAVPGAYVVCHDIDRTRLDMSEVVVVLRAAFLWALYEVEEVLVREAQTIGFRAWRYIRLEPDQIVAKDPPAVLHRDRKAGRNEK